MRHVVLMTLTIATLFGVVTARADVGDSRGFDLGIAGLYGLLVGTGSVDDYAFDVTDAFVPEDDRDLLWGLNWGDNRVGGFEPSVGYRFNKRVAVRVAYRRLISKTTSELSAYERYSAEYDAMVQVEENWEFSYGQSSIRCSVQLRPRPEGRMYLIVGFEQVRLDLQIDEALHGSSRTSAEYPETTLYYSDKDKGRASGPFFGFGVDGFFDSGRWSLFAQATYSAVKMTDTILEEEWDVDVGGLSAEIGCRFELF